MDILIKNIEMPKDDEHGFILVFTKGLVVDFTNCKVIKAIELPEHGRLIDSDALIEQTQNWYCSKENCGDDYNGIKCRACWVDDAIAIIDDAPIILEASNGSDN